MTTAVLLGKEETVRELLASGVPVDLQTEDGFTPLHFAIVSVPDQRCVSVLLEAGAEVNKPTAPWTLCGMRYMPPGGTALHLAVCVSTFPGSPVVDLLLRHGGNPNAKDFKGRTPLFYAPLAEYAEALIRAGGDVTARDHAGWTALHWAAHQGRDDVVFTLVLAGADPEARDNRGCRPCDIASKKETAYTCSEKKRERGKERCVRVLRRLGASATVIQRQFRESMAAPCYDMCRRRLMREFQEINDL